MSASDTFVEHGSQIDDGEGSEGRSPAPETRLGRTLRLGGTLLLVVAAGFLGGWPLLLMVGAFAVSIIVHEAGHYWVARRAGMKATEFFIGFGPKIFSFKRGETEYGLKVIPAGAYVRIIGMSNLEKVDPVDENRTYRSKPFRWRVATVVAGPAANLMLAMVLLIGVNLFATQRDTTDWGAESTQPYSTARALDMQPGEQVVAINGKETPDYRSFVEGVRSYPTQEATFTLRADDGSVREQVADVGWRIGPSGAELLYPLAENDVVLSLNGVPPESFDDFTAAVNSIPEGRKLSIEFFRQGGVYATTVGPLAEPFTIDDTVGYFGVVPMFAQSRLPVGDAFKNSFVTAGEMVVGSVKSIGAFFSPSGLASFGSAVLSGGEPPQEGATITEILPPPNSAGVAPADQSRILSIVGVVRLGTQAADASLFAFLSIWILVNVFLGIVNLLPLLPFDGGHIVVAIWEKLRGMVTGNPGYRVDSAKLIPASYAVIAFFLLIGLSAMWLDITSPVQNPFS